MPLTQWKSSTRKPTLLLRFLRLLPTSATGPKGRNLPAATDIVTKAEILSYWRSRGLFEGVSLERLWQKFLRGMDRRAMSKVPSKEGLTLWEERV
jgi:hypothetical protein